MARKITSSLLALALALFLGLACPSPMSGEESNIAAPALSAGSSGSVLEVTVLKSPDPCALSGLDASPSRPTWTGGASTSECGQVQSDFGWFLQPASDGGRQWMLPSSVRYGLSPRMELRWGLPSHIDQRDGSGGRQKGISDQSLSVLYRFHEQGRLTPAFAFSYGAKIPSANPGKGLGSGYADHQLVFVASRDVRCIHLDFNAVATAAGSAKGHDEAVQYGLAVSMPFSRRFTGVIDNYGGSQPWLDIESGAALVGGTFALRPWLVLDGAFTYTYVGDPNGPQATLGVTHAMKMGVFPTLSRSFLSHLLGR